MDNKKQDILQSSIATEMDDFTCDGVENLYFHAIAALTGKPYDDLWDRYNRLYEAGLSSETETVNRVGAELGFPPMWDLIGAVLAFLEDKRNNNPQPASAL